MEKDEIIRKIKGLLAKAADREDDIESQNALLMAKKWMIKYQIKKSDLDDKKVQSLKIKEFDSSGIDWWEIILASIISENFRVRAYTMKDTDEKGLKNALYFYGLKNDLDYAKKMFKMAHDNLNYFLVIHRHKIRHLSVPQQLQSCNDYLSGYLNGLKDKFEEQSQIIHSKASYDLALLIGVPPFVQECFSLKTRGFKHSLLKLPLIENQVTYQAGYLQAEALVLEKSALLPKEAL